MRGKTLLLSSHLALLALVLHTAPVFGYQGLPPLPQDIWVKWNSEPFAWLSLILGAWLYYGSLGQLWARAGGGQVLRPWQASAFGAGLAALFVALISPLNALSTALFSAHMGQHLLLILVAAPLLVLGMPVVPLLWALPKPARRTFGRWWQSAGFIRAGRHMLTQPVLVWFLSAVIVWGWHLPSLYEAALRQVWMHELEHFSLLGSALLFWWVLIRRLDYGAGILFVFTTALHSGALGALLTFARTPLYPIYTSSVAGWGLTVLEDQQLAGLLMWIPAGVIYLLAALILFARWLRSMEQQA